MRKIHLAFGCSLFAYASFLCAQTATPVSGQELSKVIVSGTLPDEASRAAILGKLRDVYGAENVVDRVEIGGVVPPPKWTENMGKILDGNIKQVHKGQLLVNGTQVAIRGDVANEALRQQVVGKIASSLNPTYTVDNGLVVAGGSAQMTLDKTLSGRVVEFESGAATLTPVGRSILDEMSAAIKQVGEPKLQLVGHTDSSGDRLANIGLSLARANAVRDYLVAKGISAQSLSALGAGPDYPVMTNNTAEGRAKNRRIEFRLAN